MALLTWLSVSLVLIVECAPHQESVCKEKATDMQSLLQSQTSLKGMAEVAHMDRHREGRTSSEAGQAEEAFRSFADSAQDLHAARASTNAVVGYETQAAEMLSLAYREVQQAEDIQEARVHQEANVTELLHEALQEAKQGKPADLVSTLRQAATAQAEMIKEASQEDQALAGLRSAMASSAQAATNAKLLQETQIAPSLDDALLHMKSAKDLSGYLAKFGAAEARVKELEAQQIKSSSEDAARKAEVLKIEKSRGAAAADRHKAEVARQEAWSMYQAASSTQVALEREASKTAESLLTVSAEAAQAAQLLQGAAGGSKAEPFH